MWTIKIAGIALAAIFVLFVTLIALAIIPLLLPEARPYYAKGIQILRSEVAALFAKG